MKKIVVAGLAAFGVAAGVGLAAPAQADTCAYFGSNPSNGICGLPNINQSVATAQKNLQNNFSVSNALKNLGFALTHDVGSDAAAGSSQ